MLFKKDPIKPQTGWNEQFANNMGVRRSSQPLLNSLNPENIQIQSITDIAPADLLFLKDKHTRNDLQLCAFA